ncbi:MAG TPA: hypothetical protein VM223_16815 [Planctomycetota bacterium]|nr:hypothetical protein [Planctomycetota bacterium]
MANVSRQICVKPADGSLAVIDPACDDAELGVCVAADGTLWIYHASCDGVGGSDGWYPICVDADGKLSVTIPDDCCTGGFGDCSHCDTNPPCDQYRIQIPAWSGYDAWGQEISHPAIDVIVTRTDTCTWTANASPAPCCSGTVRLAYDLYGWHLYVTWFSYYAEDRAPHCANHCLQWALNRGWSGDPISFDCRSVNTYSSRVDWYYCCSAPSDGHYSNANVTVTPLC